MNYFICDIVGTYNGDLPDRDIELKKLVDNLNNIIELENLEELIFCFESSDNMNFVKEHVKEFSRYIEGTRIKLGLQFSNNQYLDNDKVIDINPQGKMEQTVFLLQDKVINNVYFADDSQINNKMISRFLNKVLEQKHNEKYKDTKTYIPYNKLIQFIPGTNVKKSDMIGVREKGLSALNKILDEYIKMLKLEKKI